MATRGSAAASCIDRVLGLGANNLTSASTYWARVPPEPWTPPTQPNTSSPGANPVTPSPTTSTTPATSHPIVAGRDGLNGAPLVILTSTGLAEAAAARSRTDPWPTGGTGKSSRANNPQQSWGFEGEPPEAVTKDSGTRVGTSGGW